MARRETVREFYLKLKLKDSIGYRHIGRMIKVGPLTAGSELTFSYSGREGRAVVRRVESPMATVPNLVALPVVHADEV